ncbi:MAG: dodecin domain-containing protein [Deltaproteobacteria bacterium]|nr:dodecin domain-containing protein [Deltaproteobacteria bacterium]
MGVYKVIELVGTSYDSWTDAAKRAVETASATLEDLRVAEVTTLDMKIEDDKKILYRARVQVSFKVHTFEKYAETLGPKPYALEEE